MALISSLYHRLPHKEQTAIKRYNTIVLKRKIRIASFVPVPRLVKTFHSRIRMES